MMNGSIEDFGGYRLIQPLAKGGMAEIHLAESAVGRRVVVKRMRRQIASDPLFVEMFLREAAIAVRMQHGNIAQVFDFGEIDGEYFLVMEYVEGFSLSELQEICAERGIGLPFEFSVSVMAEVARALDHAHHLPGEDGASLGIVHRDVSPQNVMLSLDGQVKLVDFGIAKGRQSQQLTRPGVARGKYRYFAPEQVRRQPVDARTDVHACGVVLYELLTGRPPFDGEFVEVLEDIVAGAFSSPCDVEPAVPERLDRVVLQAMATDPDRRYPRASDLERDLLGWLRATAGEYGEPQRAAFLADVGQREVTATATSPRSRPRRRVTGLVAAAAAVVAITAVILQTFVPDATETGSPAASPQAPMKADARAQEVEAPVETPQPASRRDLVRRAPPPAFRFAPGSGGTHETRLPLREIALDPRTLPAVEADVAAGTSFTVDGAFGLGGASRTRTQELLYWTRDGHGALDVGVIDPEREVSIRERGRLFVMGTDPGATNLNTGFVTARLSSDGRTRRLRVDGQKNVLSALDLSVPCVDVPNGRFAIEVEVMTGDPDLQLVYIVRRPALSATLDLARGFFGVVRPGEIWSLTQVSGLWFFVLSESPETVEGNARVILRPLSSVAAPEGVDPTIGGRLLRAAAP
jgi:tRNA A-37 threonylcarbamoyl transferase component Bud32